MQQHTAQKSFYQFRECNIPCTDSYHTHANTNIGHYICGEFVFLRYQTYNNGSHCSKSGGKYHPQICGSISAQAVYYSNHNEIHYKVDTEEYIQINND